ncbi:hypothetical protein RJT34_13308 [Clitoria ternatea]|uniref:GATA-type domain-containing protein n=1 Tax=Clitoria ternatea TaxID=43366 RepID=A0AAN9PLL1_CLITE
MEEGNSNIHDFDLNIPYVQESQDFNAQNHIHIPTQDVNIVETAANIVQVEKSSATESIAENSEVEASTVEATYIASASFASAKAQRRRRRRRSRRRWEADPDRFCTNYFCKTKTTPLWRKGPLGPKTLCNACGLQYIKIVSLKGSGSSAAAPLMEEAEDEAEASTAHDDDDDGVSASVPAETMELMDGSK